MTMRVEYSSANRNSCLLHLHRVGGVLVLFARRDGADGLAGNIHGGLHQAATGGQVSSRRIKVISDQ